MGERANIVVEEGTYGNPERTPGRVWLYGHWIGSRTLVVTKDVIQRGERLTDESYLARILFEAMIPEDERGSTTSYGISTRQTDNNYPIIVFRPEESTVQIEDYNGKPLTFQIPYAEFPKFVEGALKSGYDEHHPDFEVVIEAINKVHGDPAKFTKLLSK